MKSKTKKEEHVDQTAQQPAATAAPQPAETDTAAKASGTATSAEHATPPPLPPSPPPLPPPPPLQPHPAEERLLRMRADFDNLRKRFDRERQEMTVLSNERLIKELLPVLDHLELALTSAAQHKTEKAVQDGFKIVYDQFFAALTSFGLKPLDAQGKPFDPNFHEAISQQPSDEVPEHVVMQQVRRGYLLGERLLRPAQVIVSGGPATPAAPAHAKE